LRFTASYASRLNSTTNGCPISRCAIIKPAADFKQGYDSPENPWDTAIEDALAEYAVAKCAGIHWSGHDGALSAADARPLHVRSTSHRADGLILDHLKDKDDDYFVLVVGHDGLYRLVGYIRAADGKRPEYWRDHTTTQRFDRPAYCVPQKALEPIERLLPHIRPGESLYDSRQSRQQVVVRACPDQRIGRATGSRRRHGV
jgi:hypothetical protein